MLSLTCSEIDALPIRCSVRIELRDFDQVALLDVHIPLMLDNYKVQASGNLKKHRLDVIGVLVGYTGEPVSSRFVEQGVWYEPIKEKEIGANVIDAVDKVSELLTRIMIFL